MAAKSGFSFFMDHSVVQMGSILSIIRLSCFQNVASYMLSTNNSGNVIQKLTYTKLAVRFTQFPVYSIWSIASKRKIRVAKVLVYKSCWIHQGRNQLSVLGARASKFPPNFILQLQ